MRSNAHSEKKSAPRSTLSPTLSKIIADLAQIVRPPEHITPTEWADKYLRLEASASAEPGRYRSSRVPYIRDILDALGSDDPCQHVVVMKGAQLGLTTAGLAWTGWTMQSQPAPMIWIYPTDALGKRASKQRLAPMIASVPELRDLVSDPRSRDSSNTQNEKEFRNGRILITGSNSPTALRSMAAKRIMLDEVDGFTVETSEGEVSQLAIKRAATFPDRKVLWISTPTVAGISRIEAEFHRGDQQYFMVPCQSCGHQQPIAWAQIKWTRGQPDTAAFHCVECDHRHEEHTKTKLLRDGEWQATADAADPAIKSFHISSLYSPVGWYSWEQAVRDFLDAKHAQDNQRLMAWTNTVLGETWQSDTDQLDGNILATRREDNAGKVPPGYDVLTAAVDTQQESLRYSVHAWARGESCMVLEYGTIHGDPGRPETWRRLTPILETSWEQEGTGRFLDIVTTCIDSGGHKTQAVYDYVRGKQPRIWAIKGRGEPTAPIWVAPSRKSRAGGGKAKVILPTVGTYAAKDLIFSRLQLPPPVDGNDEPGWVRFSDQLPDEYFDELTAETKVAKFKNGFRHYEWRKIRPRNEALDLFVYNLAGLRSLNVDWSRVAPKEPDPPQEQPLDYGEKVLRRPPKIVRRGRPRGSGFVNKYR